MKLTSNIASGIDIELYVNNEYYFRDLGEDNYLLTTRFASSVILSKEEFDLFREHKVHERKDLYLKLKERGFVITRNNTREIIRKYQLYFSPIKDIASFHEILPTYRCNLNCSYCQADSLSSGSNCRDMDSDIIGQVVNFILSIPLDRFYLSVQGGEPLIRYDLVQHLYEVAKKRSSVLGKKVFFSMQSNGTLLDEDIARDIIHDNIGLGVSLDGPKELHDYNRKTQTGKGTYDTVVKWIEYFREAGRPIGFIPVISNKSLEYSARDIIDEYIRLGTNRIYFKPITQSGRARKFEPMDPDKYFEFWKDGVEYILKLHSKGVHVDDKQTTFILRSLFGIRDGTHCYRRPCGAGICGLVYEPDGQIISCLSLKNQMPSIGSALKDDYPTVVSRTWGYRKMISEEYPLCDSCVYCSFCATCHAGSCREQGNQRVDIVNDFACRFSMRAYPYLLAKMKNPGVCSIFEKWAK